MSTGKATMAIRKVNDKISIIDIQGEMTAAAEKGLMDAYAQASSTNTRTIILNFSRLEYMNSSGIGLIVTLLIQINRQKQKLLTYGLNEHYQQIFALTRLNEAIGIHNSESEALAAANA